MTATIPATFDRPGAAFVLLPAGVKFPPVEKGWQERPHTFQEAVEHVAKGGNVGLLAGGGYGGLDQDDPEAFAGLELPATTSWQTRPGRLGFWLRWSDDPAEVIPKYGKPPDQAQIKLFKDEQAVGEIKLERSYQAIPPSWKLVDGRRVDYKMIDELPPAEVSLKWLLEELMKLGISFSESPKAKLAANVEKLEAMPAAARQEWAEITTKANRFLQEAVLAVAGREGSRNERGLWLACQLRDLGLDAGQASEIMDRYVAGLESVRKAGQEPYTREEALHSVQEAYKRKARGPPKAPPEEGGGTEQGPSEQSAGTTATVQIGKDYYRFTEGGNAGRFIKLHGQDVRYCHTQKRWLVWDGARWHIDTDGRILRLAEDVVRHLYARAAGAGSKDERERIASFARSCDRTKHLRNVLALASCREGIAITSEILDRNPWLAVAGDMCINLKTGEGSEPLREDYITKSLGTRYDPDATCPKWNTFLAEVFGEDEELIRYIQRAVGYSLTGSMVEHVFFFLYGVGANGKSTFLAVLRALLGDYAKQASFTSFLVQRNDRIRNDLAALAGVRLITAGEAEEGSRFSMAIIKPWVGGDPITCRFLFGEDFTYRPEAKIWLAANTKPAITERTYAAWRRVHLVPFDVVIPKEKQDLNLEAKLIEELPGIHRWALEGLRDYLKQGLNPPQRVLAATEIYRRENDSLQAFIGECCRVQKLAFCRNSDLFAAYQAFCKDSGYEALSQKKFSEELKQAPGIHAVRDNRGYIWRGIGFSVGSAEKNDDAVQDRSETPISSLVWEPSRIDLKIPTQPTHPTPDSGIHGNVFSGGEEGAESKQSKEDGAVAGGGLEADLIRAGERAGEKEKQFKTPSHGSDQPDESLAVLVRLKTDYTTQVPALDKPFCFVDLHLQVGDELLIDYNRAQRWLARGLIDVVEIVLPYPGTEADIQLAVETPEMSFARVAEYTDWFSILPVLTAEEAPA